jgi:hypothetical protein
MTRLKTFILLGVLSASLSASAEGKGMIGFIGKLGTFIDSLALRGVDRSYIGAPEKPWQVMLKGNVNQSGLKFNSTIRNAEDMFSFMQGDITWEPHIKTKPSTYLGLWAGYRGYGLGYSWNTGGDKGHFLTFGITGGRYAINLRINWFDNDEPEVYFKGNGLTGIADDNTYNYAPYYYNGKVELGSPIKTRTLFLDGYYLLNGKKCSYAAAYDQSIIQKRSAGSLIAGAMYFYSTTDYDSDANADLILLMNDIGRIRTWQASAGLGYIYNWVPTRGLLISGMAIPMITFQNHIKLWRYDSNLKDLVYTGGLDGMEDIAEVDYKIRPSQTNHVEGKNSDMMLNVDARLSVGYEWNDRILFNVFGQFNSFRYNISDMNCRFNDWYINASIGVRL